MEIIRDRLTTKLEVQNTEKGGNKMLDSERLIAYLKGRPGPAYNALKMKPWTNADRPVLTLLLL